LCKWTQNFIVCMYVILSWHQGFVYGRFCIAQLLTIVDKWTEVLDSDASIDTIYLDLSKAFDSVPHKRLLVNLESYGLSGRSIR